MILNCVCSAIGENFSVYTFFRQKFRYVKNGPVKLKISLTVIDEKQLGPKIRIYDLGRLRDVLINVRSYFERNLLFIEKTNWCLQISETIQKRPIKLNFIFKNLNKRSAQCSFLTIIFFANKVLCHQRYLTFLYECLNF